jgi:hypothetical protein
MRSGRSVRYDARSTDISEVAFDESIRALGILDIINESVPS